MDRKSEFRNGSLGGYDANARLNARSAGRAGSVWERASAQMVLESDLERGIERGELMIHYQPKVSFGEHKIVGFEALVRWNHPLRGLLLPGEFIPLAEATGLIVPVGQFVLREACRQMASWHKTLHTRPMTIGVNASSRYLTGPHLAADIRRVLAETGLVPGCLRFEIAERSIVADREAAIDALRRLFAMNIGVEIDDFGIGQHSRSYLREIQIDALKIHNLFIQELGGPNDSSEIIRAILRFVGSLGIDVAAEGVEARYQLDKLMALGCRQGQGYYFSRPLDAASATSLICVEVREEHHRSSLHLV